MHLCSQCRVSSFLIPPKRSLLFLLMRLFRYTLEIHFELFNSFLHEISGKRNMLLEHYLEDLVKGLHRKTVPVSIEDFHKKTGCTKMLLGIQNFHLWIFHWDRNQQCLTYLHFGGLSMFCFTGCRHQFTRVHLPLPSILWNCLVVREGSSSWLDCGICWRAPLMTARCLFGNGCLQHLWVD